nr:hypothetical protein [Tanacetum cinerariifolium]
MLVKEVLMMVLVMHTEEDDMVLHIEKTSMLMLVVEIDVGGMTVDVVDKLNCSSNDVQPRQVDLRRALHQNLNPFPQLFSNFVSANQCINLREKSLNNDVCGLDVTVCLNGFCWR